METRNVWIEKLQEEAEIPEIVYQKAEQSFEKIRAEQKEGKRRCPGRKRIAVIILAAVLMASTLTAVAATYFHWNDKFMEEYGVSPEIEKKLNESNAAKEINESVEHNGVRIEAVQSVADKNVAHIVFKIYGSEEFPLNAHMGFGNVEVWNNGSVQGFSGGFIKEGFGDGGEDFSDGIEYEIIMLNEGAHDFLNKEITFKFSNIIDEYEGKINGIEAPVLLESVWELNLLMDNEDSGKVYEVNRQVPGSAAVVKSVHLSSVSCIVDFDWEYQTRMETYVNENGEEGTFEHLISPPECTGVVYEDGSVLEAVTYPVSGHFTNEGKTEYQAVGVNAKLIEYENIRELIFSLENGNVRVSLK